jgi:hypothetical protein
MQSLRKFVSLEPVTRRLLLQTVCLLPLTALGLRLIGLRRVHAGLARLAGPAGGAPPEDVTIRIGRSWRVVDIVARRGPYRGNGLSRSQVLWWLLRRQGIESDLRIGVRNETELFQAHAWVEYKGQPLNESEQVYERYTAFDQPIAPERVRLP